MALELIKIVKEVAGGKGPLDIGNLYVMMPASLTTTSNYQECYLSRDWPDGSQQPIPTMRGIRC
jgi:hypothetical protein